MTDHGAHHPPHHHTPTSPTEVVVFAANFDFANGEPADQADADAMLARGMTALLACELYSTGHHMTRLADLLPDGWHVHQGESGGKAMTGIAVAPGTPTGAARFALAMPHLRGVKLGMRYIAWQDVMVDGSWVRLLAWHFPPPRYAAVWWVYARVALRVIRRSPHPVVCGGDVNTPVDGRRLRRFARKAGLEIHGDGIDAILQSKVLTGRQLRPVRNARTRSDHPFVGLVVAWATGRRGVRRG